MNRIDEHIKTINNAKILCEFAKEKGWSLEELMSTLEVINSTPFTVI